ncbi:MAG: hypothetical protein H6945_09770 [Zoogloeaceae bacterium]|nr:hypothetical protein [Rhodocyclaceae bacterium]MCP5236011.1 hypothetical protein [Zoogloeaceae bacterium]
MLTVDDLDHFSDARLAHLFATPGSQQDPDQLARLARIVACLKFCSHLPDAQLLPGGGHAAQTLLRQALRSQRRGQLDGDGLAQSLETVLALLGAAARHAGESDAALEARNAIEAEVQKHAARHDADDSVDPQLLAALATGAFEILPTSELDELPEALRGFGRSGVIDLDLAVDIDGVTEMLRLHLALECSAWRWQAVGGSCYSRNGEPAVFLEPDEPLATSVLAGLALRNGRHIVDWYEALPASVCEAQSD